jgi:cell division protein ZapD
MVKGLVLQCDDMNSTIIYDYPLNEIVRASMRLEQLFQQIDQQLQDISPLGTRNIINSIINVLQILDRPDLKSKLAKELATHVGTLARFASTSNNDTDKNKMLSGQLEDYAKRLIDRNGKLGYRLRDIELLNTLRMHFATPGSGCSFDIPLYHHWLQRPVEERKAAILEWLSDFTEIRAIIDLLLHIVRHHGKTEEKVAIHGFHQELLDPQSNLRMIRIGIPSDICAYPEISIGRHFLSVRYFTPLIEKRPTQYTNNLPFWIAYCSL